MTNLLNERIDYESRVMRTLFNGPSHAALEHAKVRRCQPAPDPQQGASQLGIAPKLATRCRLASR
jgi:hypothetical protein